MRKVRVAALFCGMGQLDLGFELAGGYEIVYAAEFWPKAAEVWTANRRHLGVECQVVDVKTLRAEDLPEFDLLIGGPPCQPFSAARKMQSALQQRPETKAKMLASMGLNDPRNCIPDFLRIARAGRHWLMENVEEGLIELHGVGGFFCDILPQGYHSRRLVASKYGDVTHRKRWFYSDVPFDPVQAPTRRRLRHPDPALDIADREADADESRYFKNRYCDSRKWAKHADSDGFFGTITTESFKNKNMIAQRNLIAHPRKTWTWPCEELVRCPTVAEMQRAHSIPDAWDWCGASEAEVSKMIGNGVPVGMATAVAKALRGAIESSERGAA